MSPFLRAARHLPGLITWLAMPVAAFAVQPEQLPLGGAGAPAKTIAPLAVPPPQLAGTIAVIDADGQVALQCREVPNLEARATFLERAERRRLQEQENVQ
ncbi:MAG TPA: hypothetical protein VMR06_13985 [Dokdonella sp.]|uniref:hypothetical protein n=1 Tax=Dokdonella sp. TaxID=2291710 RepID=UPI002C9384D0|nr:hypothetical protein [Dokdonella sp.]HUD43096.1 hypothetical protein [Dokdonella sp.]